MDHRSYKRQGKEEIPTIHLGVSAGALERKGVETEKGNINREIKKHNSIVKAVRERIAEITSWLNDFTKVLFDKYEQYKQEKKEEYENKVELFYLYEYISIYYDLQGEKARKLNPYASNKKISADLNRFSKARIYLSDNRLQTIADLQGKIIELQGKNKNIYQDIKAKTQRIETLHQCLVYADIVKANRKVYEEWKGNPFLFKDSFYNAHQEEIDKYQRAKGRIEKLSGESALKPKSWKKEIESLESETSKLNKQSQSIKDEYEQINHIKYAVKTVNEDYGIDLSIEIDKAIKRGEKPSVITQIKNTKSNKKPMKNERKGQRIITGMRKDEVLKWDTI